MTSYGWQWRAYGGCSPPWSVTEQEPKGWGWGRRGSVSHQSMPPRPHGLAPLAGCPLPPVLALLHSSERSPQPYPSAQRKPAPQAPHRTRLDWPSEPQNVPHRKPFLGGVSHELIQFLEPESSPIWGSFWPLWAVLEAFWSVLPFSGPSRAPLPNLFFV